MLETASLVTKSNQSVLLPKSVPPAAANALPSNLSIVFDIEAEATEPL